MPISGWDPVFPVMQHVQGIAPKRVLDIGIGTGQWGFLVRNYHDFRYGRFDKHQWETDIIGIEAWEAYRNPAWELYTEVVITDAYQYLQKAVFASDMFDVVLMIEVLEHFEKEQGAEVLRMLSKISRNFIFSYANMPQGAAHGNEYEVHRAIWSDEEIKALFPVAHQIYETGVGKYYCVSA